MTKQSQANICSYVGCKTHIAPGYFLCFEHFEDWQDELINQCPKCGRFKDAQYDLCSTCYFKRPTSRWTPPENLLQQKRTPKVEHSKAWEKADKDRTRWFVYILKSEDADFYIGQTGELRERLMEHRDSKTKATKGKEQKFQYFEILASRKSAELREAELESINKSNPRQIRRMILEFKDYIDELNYE